MLLKVVSAIVVAGDIVSRDEFVEVSASEGKDLLRRGKCVEPTAAELTALSDSQTAIARSGTEDAPENPDIAAFNEGSAEAAADAAPGTPAAPAPETAAPARRRKSQ